MTVSTILHYDLVEKIGEGGMGVVWRAHDQKLGRDVAVKVLREQFMGDRDRRTRFKREAKAIAALNHPNIVTIHAVEEVEELCLIIMEFVQGEALIKHIPGPGLALNHFLELAIPLADALSSAHECGIIHCDLKPSNILLSKSGVPKILDFGLARVRAQETALDLLQSSDTTITSVAQLAGTVSYMSPEQLRCEPLDHRSDIFSLGIVLYEMATGQRPFQGKTAADVVASILKDTPVAVDELRPDFPHWLELIIRQCLEKNTRQRMQSALDLRNELEQLKSEKMSLKKELISSIAVLPFTDMSREKDQAYFCEGMAEEIINALSRIRDLHVVSRTSAFQFREGIVDSQEIGRRLRVGSLLEGSVRKSGNRLRIGVQLTNVADGYQLWAGRYDRDMSDVFAVQDEIARNIVQALQVALTPREGATLRKIPTRDVQAYDYYLRGRKFYYQYGKRDIEFALQLFSRAIELDPAYALAYAGLADCWSYLYLYAERSESARLQADLASRKAVELDPESAQAHASWALSLSLNGRDEEAEWAFETAVSIDPHLFEAYYFHARQCFAGGQFEKAARLFEEASRVRPEDFQSPLLVAQIYDELKRETDAREARQRGVAIAEQHLKLNPDDARAVYMTANGLAALGERERGREWAQRALAMSPEDGMLLYNVGCIYSLLGDVEEAIDCLEKSAKFGLTQKGWFEHDSNLDPLRNHPRFKSLLQGLM